MSEIAQSDHQPAIPVTGRERPFVTVVMPVRNEGSYIGRALESILKQDYPQERIEVIVADGMSGDDTRAVVAGYARNHPGIRLIDNPGQIVPTGLNLAIAQARGSIIVRVDGHCEIAGDYVRLCVEYLTREDIAGVGGPMETIGETPAARAIALAMSSAFGVGGSAFRTIRDRRMYVETVAFPGYKRDQIEAAGPFDEEMVRNQDDEYNYRLRKMGGKILMAPEIRSRYYSRTSYKKLWRQYFQYGYYKVRVLQKLPHQMRLQQFAPAALLAALGFSAILGWFLRVGWVLLGLTLGLYVLANLAASFFTARSGGMEYFWRLPLIFAILHFSYGTGFIAGLVKYANRWGERSSQPLSRSAS
jgi:glycosyltransferase involved in cell wall biosynthesis